MAGEVFFVQFSVGTIMKSTRRLSKALSYIKNPNFVHGDCNQRLRDQGRGHQGEVAGEPVGLRKGHVNAGPGGCVIKGVGIKVRLRASRVLCSECSPRIACRECLILLECLPQEAPASHRYHSLSLLLIAVVFVNTYAPGSLSLDFENAVRAQHFQATAEATISPR